MSSAIPGRPIETRRVLATLDSIGGAHHRKSTQWPHTVRGALAQSLGVPEHKIRVIAPDLGGGFGVKQDIYPEEMIVPLVAKRLGRPVRWIETRREHFFCTAHSREQDHEVELALDEQGVVLGLRALVTSDLGAYTRGLGVLCPSITAGSLLGPYRIKHYHAKVRCALTNKAPAGAYRGAGGPEAVYALERTLDKAARELGIERRPRCAAATSFSPISSPGRRGSARLSYRSPTTAASTRPASTAPSR